MADGVIYAHTVDAVMKHLSRQPQLLTPQLEAALQRLGVNPKKPTDVPFDKWIQVLELLAAALSPGRPRPEAQFELGRAVTAGYLNTLVGRTVAMVASMLGVRKTLLQIAQSFSTADNVTQVTVEELGPRHIRLRFNAASRGFMDYDRGLLHEALHKIAKGLEITGQPLVDGSLIDVKWS